MSSSVSPFLCSQSHKSYGVCAPLLCQKSSTTCPAKCRTPSWRSHAATGEEANASPPPPAGSLKPSKTVNDPAPSSAKGFGPRPAPSTPKSSKESPPQKQKKSVTARRPAPVRPVLVSDVDPEARQRENAFILALAALGVVIFIEGIALASSGLLPEEWDAVIVKYVYPAFTPTVGLFLAGAVFYGVYKIFQGGGKPGDE